MRKLLFFKSSARSSGKTEKSNRSPKGLISKFIILFCSCHLGSAGSSRPVDGEQQQEMSRPKKSYSQKNHAGNGNGSERLSQSHVLHKTRSTDYDPDSPISIEDIYGGSSNGCPGPIDGSNGKNFSGFHKQSNFPIENCTGLNSAETRDDIDVELHRASKEAEDRVALVSEELEQDIFLQNGGFGLPAMIQTIRDLAVERMNLALEVSSVLRDRIADRAAAEEELKVAKAELDATTRRLEREKEELQSALEKELDRRSSDWTFKLEKYQSEEQSRLLERVRELAEQNVSLQREVSSFHEREAESRKLITDYELQMKDLTARTKEAMEENQSLQKNLSELQEKYRAAEEDRLRTNFEESTKQLTIMKGILPKVSGDRDMLGERVKQCSEENMLLSAEVNILKKKIEAIEENLQQRAGDGCH